MTFLKKEQEISQQHAPVPYKEMYRRSQQYIKKMQAIFHFFVSSTANGNSSLKWSWKVPEHNIICYLD